MDDEQGVPLFQETSIWVIIHEISLEYSMKYAIKPIEYIISPSLMIQYMGVSINGGSKK